VSADGAGRPVPGAEGLLAAVVLAVVSLLLLATLPLDMTGTAGNGAESAPSRPAGRR
jgi:hypothetical protein